jgi:hypothetical protein
MRQQMLTLQRKFWDDVSIDPQEKIQDLSDQQRHLGDHRGQPAKSRRSLDA